MSDPSRDLPTLLASLAPRLNSGDYVYSRAPSWQAAGSADALFAMREDEGITIVTTETAAARAALPILLQAAWITLRVHSDLQAVGLTAAFATALAQAGISCNVVAGASHDHLFVPRRRAHDAMARLQALQAEAMAIRPRAD